MPCGAHCRFRPFSLVTKGSWLVCASAGFFVMTPSRTERALFGQLLASGIGVSGGYAEQVGCRGQPSPAPGLGQGHGATCLDCPVGLPRGRLSVLLPLEGLILSCSL